MRRAKRTDRNQAEVVAKLRERGYTVEVTSHIGWGFPDLLVFKRNHGIAIELKDEGKREQLTDKERQLAPLLQNCGLRLYVATSAREIESIFIKECIG